MRLVDIYCISASGAFCMHEECLCSTGAQAPPPGAGGTGRKLTHTVLHTLKLDVGAMEAILLKLRLRLLIRVYHYNINVIMQEITINP
jgi:hypothetical protein